MTKSILFDTGFWIGLYNPRDEKHNEALSLVEFLEIHDILIPWPTMYEFVNTRFSKRNEGMLYFEKILKRNNTILIDDSPYKDNALGLAFDYANLKTKNYSLVDLVIREILLDVQVRVNYFITFNRSDFNDICQKRKIEILL